MKTNTMLSKKIKNHCIMYLVVIEYLGLKFRFSEKKLYIYIIFEGGFMFCNNCGEKILDGALFCAACGCKVDPVLRSDTDNKLKTNDDLQPFEVKLDPVNQQLAEQDKKSAEIDHQPVANEIKPDDKVQTTVVSNRQPSENKQTFSDDEQRTRIYYGDNGVNNNNYSSKSIFDQPAMSGGNVAVVKKKNDNIYIIVAFIAGCVVISLLAYLLIFVNTCKQPPIEGTWFNKSGKMIRFEKNGEFTWEDKYGTYTIDNDSFLSLYFRNNSDFGKSKTYIFDNEAIYSSGDYWHISGNSLYISGEEYTKH